MALVLLKSVHIYWYVAILFLPSQIAGARYSCHSGVRTWVCVRVFKCVRSFADFAGTVNLSYIIILSEITKNE